MLSLQQLKGQIAAYASGKISLGEFEDWLAENSIDPLASGELEDLVFSVESALSDRHFGGLSQQKLRTKLQELATAIRPFARPQSVAVKMLYEAPRGSIVVVLPPESAERPGFGIGPRAHWKPIVVSADAAVEPLDGDSAMRVGPGPVALQV